MRFLSGLLLSTLLASPVAAATQSPDTTPSLTGTWTLKAAYDLHRDGSKTFGFGPQPKGILMVDTQGDYSLQVFRSDEPTFAVDEHGTRKEFKAAELASTHFGHVSLDPESHAVTFHIDLSYIQRWNGTVQVRPYTLSGDELSYQVPAQPGSDSVAVSVWQRFKDQSMPQLQSSLQQSSLLRRTGIDAEKP